MVTGACWNVGPPVFTEYFFKNPTKWTNISQVLLKFEKLEILYLHGNAIKDIKEVNKLEDARSLRKLTLHGNELENEKVCFFLWCFCIQLVIPDEFLYIFYILIVQMKYNWIVCMIFYFAVYFLEITQNSFVLFWLLWLDFSFSTGFIWALNLYENSKPQLIHKFNAVFGVESEIPIPTGVTVWK